MALPVYQSPAAMSQVLGADQNAETAEMFARKMAPRPAPGMMSQGIPAARSIPVQEEGQGSSWPPSQEEKQSFGREGMESLLPEGAGLPWNLPPYTWEMQFAKEPVPWHPEITFGEWINGVREKATQEGGEEHGEKAAQLAIKKMQALQKENAEAQEPSVEPPTSAPAPPPPMPVPPPGQQVQQQPPPQMPPQGGGPIMTAQGGGFVNRGTIAGELAPKGIMSAREAGETLHELRKRREDERNYQGYANGGYYNAPPGFTQIVGGWSAPPGVGNQYGGTTFQEKVDLYRAAQRGEPQAGPPAEEDYVYEPPEEGLKDFIPRYALGGMNIPEEAQVSEQDFMSLLTDKASEAGVSEEAMGEIAQGIPAAVAGAKEQAAANDNVMDSGIMETVDVEEAGPETDSGIAQLPAISERLVAMGEEPLVQATTGEIIFDPRLVPPDKREMLFAALEAAGIDPKTITVGGAMPINELTGLPAAGLGSFVKSVFKPFKKVGKAITKGIKKVGKFLKKNAGTILGIAGALTGNPWLAALGSGIGSLIEGKPLRSALISAGMSFVGTKWVGPWIGKQIGAATTGLSETFPGTFPNLGATFQAPTGEAVSGLAQGLPGNVSGKIAEKTATGVAQKAAVKVGYDAALQATKQGLVGKAAEKAVESAMVNSIVPGAATAISTAASPIAAANVASQALRTALPNVSAKTLVSAATNAIALNPGATAAALIAEGPSQVLMSQAAGSGIQNLLAQPLAQTVGGIGAAGLQQYTEPMVQQAVSNYYDYPEGDEDAAREAFLEQYNYTPSDEELYSFYTGDFVPQQATVGQTIGGTPGYTELPTFTAAGGGYIDGVGGPKTDSNLARLSDGEFVMTEKSVRGAGGGDRMRGAAEMYRMMNGLERRVA
jgi:hypothetical protein